NMLMLKSAGLAGGVRFGGDGGLDIFSCGDVADVMVDDAGLMMASAGIAGGVSYVPAGWGAWYCPVSGCGPFRGAGGL
ncbi:hypothetical protein ACNIU1_26465, partial [Escherichia coli]